MIEFRLFPDEADEGDVEGLAIEVAIEIEQEGFQERRAIVEGRAAAEARDAVDPLAATADPHRIDAVLEAAILVEPDIGGGIAEVAAALLAMDHFAGNEPGAAAEHGGGVRNLPFRERHADRAGGDRTLLDIDMGLHVDLDAEPGRLADQKARGADPAFAEMKVIADRDAGNPEPPDQIVVNEILRRGLGADLVESHDDGAGKPG